MARHFKIICRECKKLIMECPCPSEEKEVKETDLCNDCFNSEERYKKDMKEFYKQFQEYFMK